MDWNAWINDGVPYLSKFNKKKLYTNYFGEDERPNNTNNNG